MAAKKEEIFEVVKRHLEGRGISGDIITMDARLLHELDLDSLDTMELTLALEQEFGIELPDEELDGLGTVAETVELIERKLQVTA
ncbi:MAG: acyl carrier protein [Actinomycetota bacterium]